MNSTVKPLPPEVARTISSMEYKYNKWLEDRSREELFKDLQKAKVGTPEIESFLGSYFKKMGKSLDEEIT